MPRMETAANTIDWKRMLSPTKAAMAAPRAPRETKPANRLTVRTSMIAKPSATAIQSSVTASPPTSTTHERENWSCRDVLYGGDQGGDDERGAPPGGGAPLVGGGEATSDPVPRPRRGGAAPPLGAGRA